MRRTKRQTVCLHDLIRGYALELLKDCCTGDGVSRVDCFVSNSSRPNPFDLVAERLANDPADQRQSACARC